MEVAIGPNSNSTPFQREVREWQRVDPNTGALLSGRLEADRWINGPLNAYGKVVNSQNISQPNGIQQSRRNQLEVLQARTSSGSLQVVRAQTVQTMTSTSSHCWPSSSSSSSAKGTTTAYHIKNQTFDGQHFSNGYQQQQQHLTNGNMSADSHDHHLTSPFRSNYNSRLLVATPSAKLSTLMKSNTAAAAAITNGRGRNSPHFRSNSMSLLQRHEQEHEEQQQFQHGNQQQHKQHKQQQQQQHESETQSSSFTDGRYHQPTITVGESRVGVDLELESLRNERETTSKEELLSQHHRGRSISTDDLATEWSQNNDDAESSEWRRISKIRRSFQFPKSISPKTSISRPPDLPENSGSVSRIRHELENGRRLNTAMRGNHVDLVALNSILNGSHEPETKTAKKTTFLTAESLKEIRGKLKKLSDESLYKDDFITQNGAQIIEEEINHNSNGYSVQQPFVLQDAHIVQQPSSFQYQPKLEGNYTTNSLENRTKYRDINSSEWHLRRKSYGFEKMTSSESPMFRMETSTDSGIGRSGDLTNWSPTDSTSPSLAISNPLTVQKSTVTLANGGVANAFERPVVIQRRHHDSSDNSNAKPMEIKRHSIAVDETKYVGGETVRKAFEAKSSTVHLNGLSDETGRRQKRVEFCKTEVHFAAESGRVNIVETDGKPPPTNNFRRRRRTSGNNSSSTYLEAVNSGIPLTHFGDEHKVLFEKESDSDYKNNVTISIPIKNDNSERTSMLPKTVVEIDDESNSDEISLRSILKNKPIKPKPYHLGENVESSESLWGIRLKPVTKDSKDVKEKCLVQTEFESDPKEVLDPSKSVAERIKIVEERKDGSGYSTKINLNISNSPYSWNVPEYPKTNIMSIELHSPSSTITTIVPSEVIPKMVEMPIAKPRTVSPVKNQRNTIENDHVKTIKHTQEHDTELKAIKRIDSSKAKAPLKVVTGGARKLREHELTYFGVKTDSSQETQTKNIQRMNYNIISNSTSSRTSNKKVLSTENNIQKWKLSSDKPDLLRHSPVAQKSIIGSQEPEPERRKLNDNHDGPIYENLKKPSAYNRKKDLKRDEMILDEMTKTADQTLKTVNNCSEQSCDQNHNQLQKSSKPLETIDEKTVSRQSSSSQKRIKSKAAQVSRQHTLDGFQRSCCSNRPSSASSIESLTRYPSSKSRSQSKESSAGRIEYANIRPTKKLSSSSSTRDSSKSRHRSQSRERHQSRSHSHHSSSDDLANSSNVELVPRIRKSSKIKERETSDKDKDRKKSTSTTKARIPDNSDHHKKSHHQSLRSTVDDHVTKSKRLSHAVDNQEKSKSLSKRSSSASTVDHHHNSHHSTGSSIHHPKFRTKSSSGIVSSTYVSQKPTITRMIPPPRKKRHSKTNNLNNNYNNNNSVSLRHGYSSSSFSYFPSGNFLAMRNREIIMSNHNNKNRLQRRRNKALGVCICS